MDAAVLRNNLVRKFFIKGISAAVLSGMCYGLYSAFITVAMGKGIWANWYGENVPGLNAFAKIYVLGALGNTLNDMTGVAWAFFIAVGKGKLGDFFRCLRTTPGVVMTACAIIGGPVAGTAYIIALQMAGSTIIPVTALCPAAGAIFGRILLKQPLTPRMLVGIFICVGASIMIGSIGMGADAPEGLFIGLIFAFIAAVGWGLEGCIAGFGTVLIDHEIGILIRQSTSVLSNLIVLVPLTCMLSGDLMLAPQLVGQSLSSTSAMIFFVISGFFAVYAFSLWYRGNSMCGSALGMACNGAYSFWGPFFCWIVLGLFMRQEGWALQPLAWVAAIVMFLGIFLIAVNPLDLFSKRTHDA